jgi:hypothetical protein
MIITIDQAIGSTVKYKIDWADDKEPGETITSSEFMIGGELLQSFSAIDGKVTTVYLANGTGVNYGVYPVTNRVTINNPDGHQRMLDEFTFRVRLLPTLYA